MRAGRSRSRCRATRTGTASRQADRFVMTLAGGDDRKHLQALGAFAERGSSKGPLPSPTVAGLWGVRAGGWSS